MAVRLARTCIDGGSLAAAVRDLDCGGRCAAAYTSNADTTAKYRQSWQELQSIQGWPTQESIVTPAIVSFNLHVAGQQGALKGEGTRPAAAEMDLTPWQQAWSVFSAHESAY